MKDKTIKNQGGNNKLLKYFTRNGTDNDRLYNFISIVTGIIGLVLVVLNMPKTGVILLFIGIVINIFSNIFYNSKNKLISCPDCNKEVSKKANNCPNCGCKIKSNKKTHWFTWFILLVIIVWFFKPLIIQNESKDTNRPNIQYTITNDESMRNIKRSVEVALHRKITKDELRKIALYINKSDSTVYDKTFIEYWIKGMSRDSGCWATTHFNPMLKVEILNYE